MMTREEAILLSAYTGFLLAPVFSEVHKFCEDTLGRPIWTHEFADRGVQNEIREKLRPKIMELIQHPTALRPVSREQVEKVWRGEWMGSADGYADGELVYDTWICSECGHVIDEEDDPDMLPQFCPKCYAAMTDEAVEMMLERWKEALKND